MEAMSSPALLQLGTIFLDDGIGEVGGLANRCTRSARAALKILGMGPELSDVFRDQVLWR